MAASLKIFKYKYSNTDGMCDVVRYSTEWRVFYMRTGFATVLGENFLMN